MASFLRAHAALVAFLVVASAIAAIVYELTSGGKPRAFVREAPALNRIDLRGDHPTTQWKDDEFECLGWRATYNCDPHGPRDYTRDRACDARIARGSGYCEVRNRTSGAILRIMPATCASWQWWLVPTLSCRDARQFTDFSVRAAHYTHPDPIGSSRQSEQLPTNASDDTMKEKLPTPTRPVSFARGVVMIGYPKVIAGVYAIVRMLRHHGCALPVEVWIDPLEMQATHSVLVELASHYNVFVRTIQDPLATKFHTKPYALYHSAFDSVLLLDSDNIPAKDPTYLFDSPEFVQFGALFWPDFWRPTPTTPFNIKEQSALWSLLDMPFIDMFEQESGQVLVDRKRSQRALHKLMFYSSQMPKLLNDWHLVYGDKDLFRLAWLNSSTPFYYVQHLVALGGLYDADEDIFCGVSMVQRDPSGEIIFLHRNQAKLTGRRDQKVAITHLQKFTGGNGDATSLPKDLDKYRIYCSIGQLGQHNCFYVNPKTLDGGDTPYRIQSLAQTKYPASEKQAIHFSIEGRHFLTRKEEAELVEIERKEDAKIKAELDAVIAKRRRAALQDQVWRIVFIVASLTVMLLCIRPIEWWKRYRRAVGKKLSAKAPPPRKLSVGTSVSVSIASASTRGRSLSNTSSSSGSGGAVSSSSGGGGGGGGGSGGGSGAASAILTPTEASWRRKKSFAAHGGEDQHIL